MKKLFKNWKWYELIYLAISVLVIIVSFVAVKSRDWFVLANALFGVIQTLLVAKGLVYAPFVCLLDLVFYLIISFEQKYYGEVAISLLLTLPLIISSIVTWIKNRSNTNRSIVKVASISKKEILILALATVVGTMGAYFVLKAFNTNQLLVSTLSVVTSIVASYLLLRRSRFYAIVYMLNDIVLIVLWSLSVVSVGLVYLPTVLCFCFYFINDAYGLLCWSRTGKIQAKTEKIDQV